MHVSMNTRHGARIYRPVLLAIYDFLIFKVLTAYVWRCPADRYADLYRRQMSRNHADIGVGTGYFLDRCAYQPGEVRIGLFDLQPNCLAYASRRIARFEPETNRCDALGPIPLVGDRYDSVALGGLLHCIPGDLAEKGAVFDAIRPLMHAGAGVFGYTILNRGVTKTFLSRITYFVLQRLKVINGPNDSAGQLRQELEKRFNTVEVNVVGCIAIFVARAPKASTLEFH